MISRVSDSVRPPAPLEGPAPLNKKQKQTVFLPLHSRFTCAAGEILIHGCPRTPPFFCRRRKIFASGCTCGEPQFSEISSNSPKLAPSKVLASMHVVNHAWSSQDSPRFPKIPLSDLYAEPPGGPGPPPPPCFLLLFSSTHLPPSDRRA